MERESERERGGGGEQEGREDTLLYKATTNEVLIIKIINIYSETRVTSGLDRPPSTDRG